MIAAHVITDIDCSNNKQNEIEKKSYFLILADQNRVTDIGSIDSVSRESYVCRGTNNEIKKNN